MTDPIVGHIEGEHVYLSTACMHGLYDKCREWCKYCGVKCVCVESRQAHSYLCTGGLRKLIAHISNTRSGKSAVNA
jgi:hypothetical protein